MSEMDFEAQLTTIARQMDYPRTPDIAASTSARLRSSVRPRLISKTLAWSLTIVLILLASLMLIPPARAAILEFIQIGVVRIFRAEPTPIPPPNQQAPQTQIPVTATLAPTSQPLIPILRNLTGETTLKAAQQKVHYSILLPSYPADLGQPDYVFVQDTGEPLTVLVWTDPQKPDQVLMSLHFIPAGSWALKKMDLNVIQETNVNGNHAVWTTGPYVLKLSNGDATFTRMINGHVLIWEDGSITYRLETDSSLEEAVKIAESLQPIK
jgi:hypothetical protein